MTYTVTATINVLPSIGNFVKMYGQAIFSDTDPEMDGTLTDATILSATVLYGNAVIQEIDGDFYFVPKDTNGLAIKLVLTVIDTDRYVYILYTNAVYSQELPNNFMRLSQKIPKGIFTDIRSTQVNPNTNETIIGSEIGMILKAKAMMADDYYSSFFNVQNQVFSSSYSQELEYEYNNTVGLLSDSVYINDLFHLFSSIGIYGLNAYDLELLISQYIYFRLGTSSAVYIVNDSSPVQQYWLLGIQGFTELGSNGTDGTAILAPDDYDPVLENITWYIYNSGSFTDEFKAEVTAMILRVSRTDIGNVVNFSTIANPVDDGFTAIGPTYKTDPRAIYGKCLQYIDKSNYPLNILGYVKDEFWPPA